MKSTRRSLATLCLLVCCSTPLLAQQAKHTPQSSLKTQLVDVGGYKLRLRVAGSGAPTVVLDSGLGDSSEVWNDILPEIASFTRVVAYDRAGMVQSELGPEPRSHTQIANELHTLLQRANIAPPYVLVGHSLGGAHIRAFAHLFKDEVAGMVFVDPLNENIFASMTEKERDDLRAQQEAGMKNAPAGVQAEWRFLKGESINDFPQLRSFGSPPDVPMVVLVAGRNRPPRWVKSLLAEYGTWVTEVSEASLIVTPDSTHYIQRDEPDLVVSAIRRVVFPSIHNAMARALKEQGIAAAIALYRQMRQRYPPEFFRESTLNTLGYEQLQARHVPEAVALFRLNVEMYPNSFNTYDSLADGLMAQGDREAAIRNYRRSLALNPANTNAARMLKKLGATP